MKTFIKTMRIVKGTVYNNLMWDEEKQTWVDSYYATSFKSRKLVYTHN